MATTAHTYKIILLGEVGVGKTTLFLRLQMGDFVDLECRTNATMGIDYLERSYVFDEEEVRVSVYNRNRLYLSFVLLFPLTRDTISYMCMCVLCAGICDRYGRGREVPNLDVQFLSTCQRSHSRIQR